MSRETGEDPAGDPYRLDRFVTAQNSGGTYRRALEELRGGSKRTHWMWFVFPQIAGLGQSATARKYAVASLDEAKAYLQHPVLGPRLLECARAVEGVRGRTAEQIFGGIDERKLHSSMTLFLRADAGERVFQEVLAEYFGGRPDAATDRLLGAA
ncbi:MULTISPECIES: DUF1810 domain-containing protein [unclassified Arthrobacter]|uniref:DUF1810 domain-containing protein n=1 Tax=unclassified Arthrobacter TaxID=235627 RepID=UPI002E03C461|nr:MULTISPECIES: DUF1810 domain-containing protein [unclassified Arthrobacter]MEC5190039.1 uncharacterized protein (DUF1810 family) [Arthrobacter sp. MP_M4]MEC5201507.1 uncharacterized protein (DUF1810 family) [Arthrobacter sp. MP_M7]